MSSGYNSQISTKTPLKESEWNHGSASKFRSQILPGTTKKPTCVHVHTQRERKERLPLHGHSVQCVDQSRDSILIPTLNTSLFLTRFVSLSLFSSLLKFHSLRANPFSFSPSFLSILYSSIKLSIPAWKRLASEAKPWPKAGYQSTSANCTQVVFGSDERQLCRVIFIRCERQLKRSSLKREQYEP